MKIVLSAFILICSTLVSAQEYSESSSDSIKTSSKKNIELYIAPTYNVARFVKTYASFAGFNIGFGIREKVEIAISYSVVLNEFKKQIIFPENHIYDQTNIGLHGQYLFLEKNIHPVAGAGIRYGAISWNPENQSHDTFTDHIYTYLVFVGANWNINKAISVQGNIGYNHAENVDIVGINSTSYNGINVDLLIKIILLKL